MTRDQREFDESQLPGRDLLVQLGWTFRDHEQVNALRSGRSDMVLMKTLRAKLQELNAWASPDNIEEAVRFVTGNHEPILLANAEIHNGITRGLTVDTQGDDGVVKRDMKFIDYGNLDANDFTCTMEYSVESALRGHDDPRFDIICFVNGLPIVIIECKDPQLRDPLYEGVKDLLNYQKRQPRIFHTSEPLVSMAGYAGAKYGVVDTPKQFYAPWRSAYPLSDAELQDMIGRTPTTQDLLIAGMLSPANLLELMRHFVVFEKTGDRYVKKLARYYQFRSVMRTMDKIRAKADAFKGGGTVWHTQGSGKSLSMLFLALKLRAASFLRDPKIVLLTDQKQLDRQLHDTFTAAGYANPLRCDDSKELRIHLKNPSGVTVHTTIQKFLHAVKGAKDQLNASEEIFVLVDEAHRTQYSKLRSLVQAALPNATYIAFTGTPVDKKQRSTRGEFGGYIDKYTRKDSILDGNTVPVFHELRKGEESIVGNNIDRLFDRAFSHLSDEERDALKAKGAKEETIASSTHHIQAVTLDILDHFESEVKPRGFKGMIVANNRLAALRYRLELERLGYDNCALIITKDKGDEGDLFTHKDKIPDESTHEELQARFKDKDDQLDLLIVCDKLLTGFDAPILQAMYFDKNLQDHGLLQALDRVNRPYTGKECGLFIDYWGVTRKLADALSGFDAYDVEDTMIPLDQVFDRLAHAQRKVLSLFQGLEDDEAACIAKLGDDDVRAEADYQFRRFARLYDLVRSKPPALQYEADIKKFGIIIRKAKALYEPTDVNVDAYVPAVRKLIDEHFHVGDIESLTARTEATAVAMREVANELEGKDPEASALAMLHKLRKKLSINIDQNPRLFKSLRQRVEDIIERRNERLLTDADALREAAEIAAEVESQGDQAAELGLNSFEFAMYQEVAEACNGDAVEVAKQVAEIAERTAKLRDWQKKPMVHKRLRMEFKIALKEAVPSLDDRQHLADELLACTQRRFP